MNVLVRSDQQYMTCTYMGSVNIEGDTDMTVECFTMSAGRVLYNECCTMSAVQ